MKIFVPPLEIDDEEGFTPEKDLFDRKDFGEGRTRLIKNVDDPLVIALDGQWGSGKTTFLKMWAGELRKKGFPVVFFDAFAHDYMSDAFMALAGQIIALAQEKEKSEGLQTKEFVDKATRVGKILLRSSLKIGIKAATLGALSGDDLGGVAREVAKDIAKEASDLEDKYIGELLTKQAQEKDIIEGFKAALQVLSGSLVEKTPAVENDSKQAKKPLVFIIDELDRCRPDFALSLLERIKHFFSVQGVFFVLGVHSGQLENSVRSFYGQGIDAHNYLQKFIHFFFLIRTDEDHRTLGLREQDYVSSVFKRHEFPANSQAEFARGLIASFVTKDVLSLRAVERIASNLALSIAFGGNTRGEQYQFHQEIAVCLIIMKNIDRELYLKARDGFLGNEEFDSYFKATTPGASDDEKYFFLLWRYLLGGADDETHNFSRIITTDGRKDFVSECARRFVERTGR